MIGGIISPEQKDSRKPRKTRKPVVELGMQSIGILKEYMESCIHHEQGGLIHHTASIPLST